jgi:hypothetical protein
MYHLYSRIIEAVPTLQSEIAAASEVVNRLQQDLRKAQSILQDKENRLRILEDRRDSAEFDSITNRISFPRLESSSKGFLADWCTLLVLFFNFFLIPSLLADSILSLGRLQAKNEEKLT